MTNAIKLHEFKAGESKFRIIFHPGSKIELGVSCVDKLVVEQAGVDELGVENWHFVGRALERNCGVDMLDHSKDTHALMHVLLRELANVVEECKKRLAFADECDEAKN